jgi:uncharacterized protein (TIGR00251 family)
MPLSKAPDLPSFLKKGADGVLLRVHVQPRASQTCFAGFYGSCLKLRVQAPPVEGAANEACRRFLAKHFHLSRSAVVLRSGASAREKVFLLRGLSLTQVLSLID